MTPAWRHRLFADMYERYNHQNSISGQAHYLELQRYKCSLSPAPALAIEAAPTWFYICIIED